MYNNIYEEFPLYISERISPVNKTYINKRIDANKIIFLIVAFLIHQLTLYKSF